MKRLVAITATTIGLLAPAAPALAHAERSASSPEEGKTVPAAPEELRVTFTEPPGSNAVVEVADGCGRDVVTRVDVQNFELTATLSEGQPGKWTVRTNVISLVDGHNTQDRWTFDVRGRADCSAPETDAPKTAGDEDEDEGGSSTAPLLALGAAVVALIAIALVVRRRA